MNRIIALKGYDINLFLLKVIVTFDLNINMCVY